MAKTSDEVLVDLPRGLRVVRRTNESGRWYVLGFTQPPWQEINLSLEEFARVANVIRGDDIYLTAIELQALAREAASAGLAGPAPMPVLKPEGKNKASDRDNVL